MKIQNVVLKAGILTITVAVVCATAFARSSEPSQSEALAAFFDKMIVYKNDRELFEPIEFKITDKTTRAERKLGDADTVLYKADVKVRLKTDAYEVSAPSEQRNLDGKRRYLPAVETPEEVEAYEKEQLANIDSQIAAVPVEPCTLCEPRETQIAKLQEQRKKHLEFRPTFYTPEKLRKAGHIYVIKNVKLFMVRDNAERPLKWKAQNWGTGERN